MTGLSGSIEKASGRSEVVKRGVMKIPAAEMFPLLGSIAIDAFISA
jgi:hypothetical protein